MYKNKESVVLQSDCIRAEFIADPGGKMVSLKDKRTGYEYLLQRAGHKYKDQPFDGIYIDGECSGFDDMFPTIDPCKYHREPWKGVQMADHGEVWSLPWRKQVVGEEIRFEVSGVRFPYTLSKRIHFTAENVIRLSYTLLNNSSEAFDFLYAAHIMLNLEVGTKLIVPDDCKQAVSILSNAGRPPYQLLDWPEFLDKDGRLYRADISRAPEVEGFEKYYFVNRLQAGWVELQYPTKDKSIRVSFPTDTVPYLGILMNENGWDDLYQAIIEPCTICYDRPDLAAEKGQVSRVEANGIYEWFIEFTIE